jgi:hypothetical protein
VGVDVTDWASNAFYATSVLRIRIDSAIPFSGGPKGAAFLSGFFYARPTFSQFPEELASKDMAWLIRGTLPRFAALH